jgi:type I restriction enzyme S subunit
VSWDAVELPEGWRMVATGDIAKVVGGGTPKTSITGNFTDSGGHPWVTPADLTGYNDKYISRGRRNLTDQGLKESSATYMPAGTVLFSSRAPIGYVAIAANPVTTNQGFRSFVPSEEVDSEYLYYALKLLRADAEQLASGTTFAEISGTNAKKLRFPLAPKESQHQIVNLLDTVSDRRETATNHLYASRQAIEKYRHAVLGAAFREASQACEEEGSVLDLAQVLREPLKNGYSARPVTFETQFRVLTLTATTSGLFDGQHFKYTDEVFPDDSPFWLMPGDVVIQRGNTAEYVGVPAIYEGGPREYLYPDLMIRARVRDDIDPRYLWYMLLAPQSRKFLRDRATGSAGNMPKINQKILNVVPIPVPPIETRKAIVMNLDVRMAVAAATLRRIHEGVGHVDRACQAVARKAFSGSLTTNPSYR